MFKSLCPNFPWKRTCLSLSYAGLDSRVRLMVKPAGRVRYTSVQKYNGYDRTTADRSRRIAPAHAVWCTALSGLDTTARNSLTSFINLQEADLWREFIVDGYIVVYSITDRRSFQKACDVIVSIRQQARRPNKSLNKPLLLVANKSDLERARVVAKEGQSNIERFELLVGFWRHFLHR